MKQLALAVLIVSLIALPTAALAEGPGGETISVSPPAPFYGLTFFGDPSSGPTGIVVGEPTGDALRGRLKIHETAGGLHVDANLNAPAGNVYTVWIIGCNVETFPCPETEGVILGRAFGGEVAGNGRYASWKFEAEVPGDTDEFHIINHGPPLDDYLEAQMTVPWGGCAADFGPNDCSVTFVNLTP